MQLLEFDCEALPVQEASLRKQAFRQAVLQDETAEYSVRGYQSLRPPAEPHFAAVTSRISQPAVVVKADFVGEWDCYVSSPHLYRPGAGVSIDGVGGLVVDVQAETVRISVEDVVSYFAVTPALGARFNWTLLT